MGFMNGISKLLKPRLKVITTAPTTPKRKQEGVGDTIEHKPSRIQERQRSTAIFQPTHSNRTAISMVTPPKSPKTLLSSASDKPEASKPRATTLPAPAGITKLVERQKSLIYALLTAEDTQSLVSPRLTNRETNILKLMAIYEQVSKSSNSKNFPKEIQKILQELKIENKSIGDHLKKERKGLETKKLREFIKKELIIYTNKPEIELSTEIKKFMTDINQRHATELKQRLNNVLTCFNGQVNPLMFSKYQQWIHQLNDNKNGVIASMQRYISGNLKFGGKSEALDDDFRQEIERIMTDMQLKS
jgi:hypothetical protein